MKTGRTVVLLTTVVCFAVLSFAQIPETEKKAIVELIQEAYIGAAYNRIDTDIVKKGFHESFIWQAMHHDRLFVVTLAQWEKLLNRDKWFRPDWNDRTTAQIQVIGIEGNAAAAKVNIYNNQVHELTEFLSLIKFSDGWKITTKITNRQEVPPEVELQRRLEWEENINEKLQPPEKVMNAIGLKPGMVIGEIGAGHGRYTVHLARRVGKKGKVLANDIDENALAELRKRCERDNIPNVETILGEEEDPLFPKNSLDMAFMVWVFHGLEKPGPLFANLKSCLKSGASLVIVDPIDEEIDMEREFAGEKLDPDRPTIKQRVEKAAEEAGFKLVRMETFLPKDVIYILKSSTAR